MRSVFWDDLDRNLENPDFRREFIAESARIAMVDALINALDDARESAGMSKAELARAIGVEPSTIRRLFSLAGGNPTIRTLSEIAAVLGLRITVEAVSADERDTITKPRRAAHATHVAVTQVSEPADRAEWQ